MFCKKLVLCATGAALLSGCQGSDSTGPLTGNLKLVDPNALSAFFVSTFAPFEAAALDLRENNARYTIQENTWSFEDDPNYYDSYSLAHANVEYAHAAGLTGAGQTIAIIDDGFLQNHIEFNGSGNISAATGLGAPGVEDHGTSVASIAAGSADSGEIIGVAPGANLFLGSFDTLVSSTSATLQADAAGAIVLNNSWGYRLSATNGNYQAIFGNPDGQAYINALQNFADEGIIVFAASNDDFRTTSDLMAALPGLVDGLTGNWITAINAVPSFDGTEIESASLISSGCLDAAAWCMAADGTVVAAHAYEFSEDPDVRVEDSSNYQLVTGSSFAAPQISGAVALLAEAFPTLSAEEIRARLLASANNGFYEHSGYVEFATGLEHGYNDTYGHGFLDLRAALLPIGSAYVPIPSGEQISLDTPLVLSGGMSGDALTTRLAKQDIVFVDGLGGDFSASANILSAQRLPTKSLGSSLGKLMAVDLNSDKKNPFDTRTVFSPLVAGQEMEFEIASTNIAFLMPTGSSDIESYGVAVSHSFDLGKSALSLGINAMYEGGGFVGMKSLRSNEQIGGSHGAATFEWAFPLIAQQEVSFSGSLGMAVPDGNISSMSLSTVSYNSINASYSARDVLGAGDRFSLSLNLPQVVGSGSANFDLPVSLGAGGPQFSSVRVPLAPTGRQMDISVSYGVPLTLRSEIFVSATHSLNSGNISGREDSLAALGWRFRF